MVETEHQAAAFSLNVYHTPILCA